MNVAVLMSLRFKDYTSMPMTVRAIIIFTMRVNVLKRRLMSVPDKRNRTADTPGIDPLAGRAGHIPVSRTSETVCLQMFSISCSFMSLNF